MAESLIEAALRKLPPERLQEILRRYPLAAFLEHPPEGFEDITAFDAVDYLWESLAARPEQRMPQVEWDTWVIKAGRGWGKMLDLDTSVPVPLYSSAQQVRPGWSTMGLLRAGDMVYDEGGRPCQVTAAHPVQVPERAYRLHFSDGTTVDAGGEHLWVTWTRRERKQFLRKAGVVTSMPADWAARLPARTTDELAATATHGKRADTNHSIPMCRPLKAPHVELPVEPYALGVWLGDGNSAGAVLTSADPEVALEIKRRGTGMGEAKPERSRASRYQMGAKPYARDPRTGRMRSNDSMHSALRALGLIKNKHIPAIYLRASVEQRLSLLRGLMDTDGTCLEASGHVEYTSTNEPLARGVLELLRSLGEKPRIFESNATIYGRVVGRRWRIRLRPLCQMFLLGRKACRQRPLTGQAFRSMHRMLLRVAPIERKPMRCITVDSRNAMYLAGEGMIPTHNTRTGAQSIIQMAEHAARLVREGRLATQEAMFHLVGATAADVRDVMVMGPAGILRCSPPWFPCKYEPSKRHLEWPGGVGALLFSAEEPDRLRGPQCIGAWADELAAWKYPEEAWDNLEFGCRLGPNPRIIVTTTPRPIPQFKKIIRQSGTVVTHGTTQDNVRNLNPKRVAKLYDKYEGTRLGRQELGGELLDDNPNALWRRADVDMARLTLAAYLERHRDNLVQVVVSVDPAMSSNPESSNETGIVVVAKGWCTCRGAREMHGYVLDDVSLIDTPRKWALAVGGAYKTWRADRVLGETNQGGALVEENLRLNSETTELPFTDVHVHEGKRLRAEPCSALYEQHKVHHVGSFGVLEDQMTDWDPASQDSPDRIDALVQGLTHLLIEPPPLELEPAGAPIWRRRV